MWQVSSEKFRNLGLSFHGLEPACLCYLKGDCGTLCNEIDLNHHCKYIELWGETSLTATYAIMPTGRSPASQTPP